MSQPMFYTSSGPASNPEELVRRLAKASENEPYRDIPKAPYLDLAERIVRAAFSWQDAESGRIIDPYVHKETPTATARYIGALGALLQQNRCKDLTESCLKAMSPVLYDLFNVTTKNGEFLVKEAMMGYIALKEQVKPELRREWEHLFSDYDPELTYARTRTTTPDVSHRHNFITFSIAGEAFKKHFKLADNRDFVNEYLTEQLDRFDSLGMYRDPHCPIVYDITPRMNLEIAEHFASYEEPIASRLRHNLWNGALCMLLYQSPTGEMPFGGRSNQQNFIEATFAIICELEACRCRDEGDMLMAGVFRRAAARAVNSIAKYIEDVQINFNKNRFPPSAQHGRQRSYGHYGAYSLLIASQLAMASLFADDTIPFANSTPAESGTYLWTTTDDFHKLFAYIRGNHVELELMAAPDYDAQGWGRWHILDAPAELALSCPISADPSFLTVIPPVEPLAIGPGTSDGFVAAVVPESPDECKLHSISVTDDAVEFAVDWPCFGSTITEKLRIMPNAVTIEASKHGEGPVFYRVPMLLTDGESWGTVQELDNGFALSYKGFTFSAISNDEGVEKSQEKWIAANRNALYRSICFKAAGGTIHIELHVSKE